MGKYTFSGVDYELPIGVNGQELVDGYKAKGLTDTVIAGVLAAVGKVIATAVKKSADQIFESVKAKTAARQDVKEAMPQLAKAWARYDEVAKKVDELESIVLVACKEEAGVAGFMKDAIALDFDSAHKLVFHPVTKSHGGSAAGSHRETGRLRLVFKGNELLTQGTAIVGSGKQDVGKQLWPLIESKWAGVKPYTYEGKVFYNKMVEAIIADGLVEVEHIAKEKAAPEA